MAEWIAKDAPDPESVPALEQVPETQSAKEKLEAFLDEQAPELALFLMTLWHNQARAITYKELREALLRGEISPEWMLDWQQDYSRFVTERLAPAWETARLAAAEANGWPALPSVSIPSPPPSSSTAERTVSTPALPAAPPSRGTPDAPASPSGRATDTSAAPPSRRVPNASTASSGRATGTPAAPSPGRATGTPAAPSPGRIPDVPATSPSRRSTDTSTASPSRGAPLPGTPTPRGAQTAGGTARARPDWHVNPAADATRRWTESRAAAFVTNSTQTQLDGLRALIHHAAESGMSVDELARTIRPMVGLTRPQAVANANYLNTLLESGMSEEKAREKALKYAAKQHRYRGYNIARTELAFAYNKGILEGAKQAQELGLLGRAVKVWCTADDDIPESASDFQRYRRAGVRPMKIRQGGKTVTVLGRTCKVCRALHGTRIGLDEDFPFNTRLTEPGIKQAPPAHPSCRCTIKIVEVDEFGNDRNAPRRPSPTETPPEADRFDYIEEVAGMGDTPSDSAPASSKPLTTEVKTPIMEVDYDTVVDQTDKVIREYILSDKQPKTVLVGKQSKHIKGHNNYTDERSYLSISIDEVQELVNQLAGTGDLRRADSGQWTRKEFIIAPREIGIWKDWVTGLGERTHRFYISYSKKGVHIVPAREGEQV